MIKPADGKDANIVVPAEAGWLAPENTTIFEGLFSALHCTVNGELHRSVFATRLFPVSFPEEYISLRDTSADGKVSEIGIIRRLADFPEDTGRLLRDSLNRYYHEQTIRRVHNVRCRYGGLLFFDVETQRGREEFVMWWSYDCTEDYGQNGKVLLDIDENRYVVPDVDALLAADRRRFRKHIYW
ncbi:MAG TPA: DUF1854 domain-containing protein [Planctomycetes bacterium]|nr:DUF1854 domain-containing protein [Planctomycetota bacterium]